jgi:hypothetical protein
LNEDGMLDRKIFLDLSTNIVSRVGRKAPPGEEDPEICLGGIGINAQHAAFNTTGNIT